jgi:hypothetical protein
MDLEESERATRETDPPQRIVKQLPECFKVLSFSNWTYQLVKASDHFSFACLIKNDELQS